MSLEQSVSQHYTHGNLETALLEAVQRAYPAGHYVAVDDKPGVLGAIKEAWGERVTTVFIRQGHYALDPNAAAMQPPADITLARIADLKMHEFSALLPV